MARNAARLMGAAVLPAAGARRPVWRPSFGVVAAIAVVIIGAVVRWRLLFSPSGAFNSDEAVTGLMARSVLRGHLPVFVEGNPYGAAFESVVFAPFERIFGPSRLLWKLSSVLVWAVASWVVGRAVRRSGGVRFGAVIVWGIGGGMAWLSTFAYAGYPSGILFTAIAFDRALAVVRDPKPAVRRWLVLGASLALALWAHPLFVAVAVPLGVALLIVSPQRWALLKWSLVGAFVAFSPVLGYNVAKGFPSLDEPPTPFRASYGSRLFGLVHDLLPRTFGLRSVGGQLAFNGYLVKLLVAVVGIFTAACVWALIKAGRRGELAVIALPLAAALPIMAAFDHTEYTTDGRYGLIVVVPIALLWGIGAPRVFAARPLASVPSRSVAIGAAVVIAFGVNVPFVDALAPVRASNPEASMVDLVQRLDRAGIRSVMGEYFVVYRVAYTSQERIAAAALLGQPRFPGMARRANSTPPSHTAGVFAVAVDAPDLLPEGIRAGHVRVVHGEFVVYLPADVAATFSGTR